jgi:hypothetical protein
LKEHSSAFVEIAPKEVCEGEHHMQQFLQDIIDGGGEGIILRDPLCLYQPGRSSGFLKHKVFFSHSNKCGSLLMLICAEIQRCRSKSGERNCSTSMGMCFVRFSFFLFLLFVLNVV